MFLGACEGTLTCSTCHVILQQKDYDFLEKPSDEELDMLDLAYELTDTLVLFVLYNFSWSFISNRIYNAKI